ncbi:DNA ligase 1 isoform X2 [Glycine max]|uniref:DNA ligase 1 isoform X2 n=1 Tax=Glycine max TaxID=3847 RepID=UPI001B355710|nr:DNA ligase 1 isoform X2 [Glycine max]
MGYIHHGRTGLRHLFRFRTATGVVKNSARSQLRTAFLSHSSPILGNNVVFFSTGDKFLHEITAEVEKDRRRERNERLRLGLDTADIDAESEQDYMGVGPLIAKLEKEMLKESAELNRYEEPTDSEDDSDEETMDDADKKVSDFEKKKDKHMDLLDKFTSAETLDDAFKWMAKIDNFENKHFRLRPEYRVIGELMNRLKVATELKDKFVLQNKLNRALRLVRWKEAYDPDNPANYGVIQREQPTADAKEEAEFEKEKQKQIEEGDNADDEEEQEFDDMKEKDNVLMAKLEAIDRKLEEKLAELEYTFGRKGKALEEEIKDLAEERNELTEQKRKPLYRKGFDTRLIDMNRTCKVTKGGQVVKYTAMVACGNYNGVIGFAKAKGPAVPVALQKAYEKCFQNLHYVERHEEHTIAHAVQTSYKKTKVYLWPAPTTTGMKAGRSVEAILHLAGLKNVKSKIETPRDVQEKFGRTVVEKYLL